MFALAGFPLKGSAASEIGSSGQTAFGWDIQRWRGEGDEAHTCTFPIVFFWLSQTLCSLVGQCKKLYFLDIVGLIDDWSKKSSTLFSANKVNGDANGAMGDQDCPGGLVEQLRIGFLMVQRALL